MNEDVPVQSDLLRGIEIPDGVLRDLPKADLHVHLDGSLRFTTFVELCAAGGVALPGGDADAARAIFAGEGSQPLDDYIPLFDLTGQVLQDAAALTRVARELVEDAAAENVWHQEVRFAPMLHTAGGLSPAEATDAVLAGLRAGAEATGTSAGLILAAVRHHAPAETQELAELAVAYKGRGVTGFDLAGPEAHNPAKEHREAFYIVQNANLNITIHAGEDWGPESIHQALHYLNAHRIGHGTRLEEDADLRNYVANHRIPVEVGLSSSVRTQSVPSLEAHPLRRFLRHGLRVVLTSNNRLFLDTDLTGELRRAADTFDLTLLEVENLLVASFKSAFLPQPARIERIRAALSRFREVRAQHGLEVTLP